jgi:methylphosphotriester-DNA--protein-cysteine methyltransferase
MESGYFRSDHSATTRQLRPAQRTQASSPDPALSPSRGLIETLSNASRILPEPAQRSSEADRDRRGSSGRSAGRSSRTGTTCRPCASGTREERVARSLRLSPTHRRGREAAESRRAEASESSLGMPGNRRPSGFRIPLQTELNRVVGPQRATPSARRLPKLRSYP